MNDNIHIQAILSGDTKAFTHLLKKYQQMVFAVVLKIVGQRERAEEITQDVFVKVFKSLHTFKKDSQFSTWLYRIAYNAAISEVRRSKPLMVNMDDFIITRDIADDNEISPVKGERLKRLQDAMNILPPEDAVIITLHYHQHTSVADIANITGLSEGNVKVKLHRIRKKLYEEITAKHE